MRTIKTMIAFGRTQQEYEAFFYKGLLIQKNKTQEWLAQKVKVTRGTINRWFNNRYPIPEYRKKQLDELLK
jgi:predicted transcriptional regulator